MDVKIFKYLFFIQQIVYVIILNLLNRDLTNNQLYGSIPTQLGNLTQLQAL